MNWWIHTIKYKGVLLSAAGRKRHIAGPYVLKGLLSILDWINPIPASIYSASNLRLLP